MASIKVIDKSTKPVHYKAFRFADNYKKWALMPVKVTAK